MQRILVVEDERKINDLVKDYLSSLGYGLTQAFTGQEALDAYKRQAPDLIVLDVMLPGVDGIEVARRIRLEGGVPIIMLTARDSEADKLLGLEIGADDYLTKPFSIRELGARVRAVLRRFAASDAAVGENEVLTLADLILDPARRRVERGGREITLTSAQFEILRLLLSNPGKVYSRRELIEKISGYDYEGYERTVDVHVKNIRKALEDDPANPRFLLTVWGAGYKMAERP